MTSNELHFYLRGDLILKPGKMTHRNLYSWRRYLGISLAGLHGPASK